MHFKILMPANSPHNFTWCRERPIVPNAWRSKAHQASRPARFPDIPLLTSHTSLHLMLSFFHDLRTNQNPRTLRCPFTIFMTLTVGMLSPTMRVNGGSRYTRLPASPTIMQTRWSLGANAFQALWFPSGEMGKFQCKMKERNAQISSSA